MMWYWNLCPTTARDSRHEEHTLPDRRQARVCCSLDIEFNALPYLIRIKKTSAKFDIDNFYYANPMASVTFAIYSMHS